MSKTTLGLIVGHRDVFPDELAKRGRQQILSRLKEADIDVVVVSEQDAPNGVVRNWQSAEACARVFRANGAKIDGILVTLPDFGDERAVADAIRLSGLSVPVFVHAFADKVGEFSIQHRRDSFCGKLSVCSNLTQYGIPYSIGKDYVSLPIHPDSRKSLLGLPGCAGWCAVENRAHRKLWGNGPYRSRLSVTARSCGTQRNQRRSKEHGRYRRRGQRAGRLRRTSRGEAQELADICRRMKKFPRRALLTTAKLGVVLTNGSRKRE